MNKNTASSGISLSVNHLKQTPLLYAGLLHIGLGVGILYSEQPVHMSIPVTQHIPVVLIQQAAKQHQTTPVIPAKSSPKPQLAPVTQQTRITHKARKPTPRMTRSQQKRQSVRTSPPATLKKKRLPRTTTVAPRRHPQQSSSVKKTLTLKYQQPNESSIGVTVPTDQPSDTPAHSVKEHVQTAYIQQIHQLLKQHKRYPRLARRRGKQGTVQVSFNIQADGSLDVIQLHTSSNHPSLDTAALQAVHRLNGLLPPLPESLKITVWPVKVPIIYSLQNR